MKLYKNKLITSALVLALGAGFLCSCGGNGKNGANGNLDLAGYPIKTDKTLTYWIDLPTNVSSVFTNLGETEFAKELEKRTGVKIEYVHPSIGQGSEAFSLMIASGDMTDMIKSDWSKALGGPSITMADNVIVNLDDLIEKYAPGLKGYLDENPDLARRVRTDDGHYYVFPFVRGDEKLYISSGPVIRHDWLESVGMQIPETIDEMEAVLRAFKDILGVEAPLTMLKTNPPQLINICQSSTTFYVEDGKVKFGPLEDDYKSALVRLSTWFNDGLLDKNYVSTDSTLLDSNMLNGISGVTYASGGSGVGKWLETMESKGESFDIVGIPYLSTAKGTAPRFDFSENAYAPHGSVAITSVCKSPELAAKFLDYGYTEEGRAFFNFGTEGVSYTMVDGYPTYTDEIMKNPDGLTVTQAMGKYFMASNNGPFIQDKRYIEQYYSRAQQKESLVNWTKFVADTSSSKLPSLTYTTEENTEYANIIADVDKFVAENTAQYISGIKSLDSYDKFIADMKSLKIERAIEIVQAAYDRYLSR